VKGRKGLQMVLAPVSIQLLLKHWQTDNIKRGQEKEFSWLKHLTTRILQWVTFILKGSIGKTKLRVKVGLDYILPARFHQNARLSSTSSCTLTASKQRCLKQTLHDPRPTTMNFECQRNLEFSMTLKKKNQDFKIAVLKPS
jgi:hypothetical protein